MEPGRIAEHSNFKSKKNTPDTKHRAGANKYGSKLVTEKPAFRAPFPNVKQISGAKGMTRQHKKQIAQSPARKAFSPSVALLEYYISQAGLVLSWPYLEKLFSNVGYTRDQKFLSTQLQERAVHLLGFISTGLQQLEEPVLMLPKLLAGWPLELPVVKKIWLTNEERNEAELMLESMITNWTILKSTSVESFRTSFLQRDGKMIKEDHGWRVIVEQKSFDMLLDHLPYSLQMIMLPWRNDIIKVDWA